MRDYHTKPVLSFRTTPEAIARVRAEAARAGRPIGEFATELMLTALDGSQEDRTPHRCPVKGWCGECKEMKGGKR